MEDTRDMIILAAALQLRPVTARVRSLQSPATGTCETVTPSCPSLVNTPLRGTQRWNGLSQWHVGYRGRPTNEYEIITYWSKEDDAFVAKCSPCS